MVVSVWWGGRLAMCGGMASCWCVVGWLVVDVR